MIGVALLTSALLALADSRIYERCELARDLLSFGIRREHLATWVCIAFHESRFDTAARNPYSGDHGLLQISELYWCGVGKACSLPCSALRDDDISDDVECALRVHQEHTRLQGNGFLAWVVYPQHCKHNAKKYLADCESLVKTPSVRTDGRSRVLKLQKQNVTSFSRNPKIDELLPPYLTIGSLFTGKYEKKFEENYNNKVRIDWVNYKIDNIDDLKLPVFNQKVIGEYTTTTTATTTTTTPLPLPNIKPPSPRRIESNSFRRKKLRPIFETVNFLTTNNSTPVSLSTIIPERNNSKPSIEYVTKLDELPKSESTTYSSLTTTTTTIRPTTKSINLFSPFTAITVASFEEQTTVSPILYTSNPIENTIVQESSTELTDISSSTKSSTSASITELVTQSLLLNKTRSSFSDVRTNLLNRTNLNAAVDPISILSSTSIVPTATIKNLPFTNSSPWRRWRTTTQYNTSIISTTLKPSSITWNSPKSVSSAVAQTYKDIAMGFKNHSSTSNPWTKTREPVDSTTSSNELLISVYNTSLSKTPSLESTTSKLYFMTSTINPLSTASPTMNLKSTTKSIELLSSTTTRTTQSIFDLYLNPTKRPKLPAFSFPPFKNKIYSLRIFADGTTQSPVSSRSERSKSALEKAENNQMRGQTPQIT